MIDFSFLSTFLQNPVKAATLGATMLLFLACIAIYAFKKDSRLNGLKTFSIYLQLAFVFSAALTIAFATTCATMILPCQNTQLLSLIAFSIPFALAALIIFGPLLFPKIYAFYSKAKNISGGTLHQALEKICLSQNQSTPVLYAIDSAKPFAFSFSGGKGAIFISVGMMDLFSKKELEAVLFHELAHIKAKSTTFKLSVAILRAFSFSPAKQFNGALSFEEAKADEFAWRNQGTQKHLVSAKRKLSTFESQVS